MNTRVWESWIIVEFYKEAPPLFSLFLKMLETWMFFDLLLTFNVREQNVKKASCYTNKSIVFIII